MKAILRNLLTAVLVAIGFCGAIGLAAGALDGGVPLGLPLPNPPASNPGSMASIELGRRLFFDQRLSRSGQVACATCHRPDMAFTDGKTVAIGIEGREGTRNTPTVLNAGYGTTQFWDGRRATLEEQVLDPFFNTKEHGISGQEELLRLIGQNPEYPGLFKKAFGIDAESVSAREVSYALAAYVRSLAAGNSPLDRYLYGGDKAALSPAQVRGLEIFRGAAQCTSCHPIGERNALLTDNDFHSMAIGLDRLAPRIAPLVREAADATPAELDRLILGDAVAAETGRFLVTRDPRDIGKFKTPSLRNVALTAPYMHDGGIATLEDAVAHEIYYRGQAMGRPLILTPTEKSDLVAFLKALTSDDWPH